MLASEKEKSLNLTTWSLAFHAPSGPPASWSEASAFDAGTEKSTVWGPGPGCWDLVLLCKVLFPRLVLLLDADVTVKPWDPPPHR